MYRDERYHFMQLGRFIERAQLSASLFLAQLASDQATAEYAEEDWTTLLRLYHAFQAYNGRYGAEVRPDQALDLLATDHQLPDSLSRSLAAAEEELAAIASGPNANSTGMARRWPGVGRAVERIDILRMAGPGRPRGTIAPGERALSKAPRVRDSHLF